MYRAREELQRARALLLGREASEDLACVTPTLTSQASKNHGGEEGGIEARPGELRREADSRGIQCTTTYTGVGPVVQDQVRRIEQILEWRNDKA